MYLPINNVPGHCFKRGWLASHFRKKPVF